jgi:hypothetical protein
MFPKLSMEEIDCLRRLGTVRRYAAAELLCATAAISPGMLVILSGAVAISGREGLGHVFPIIELGVGGFLVEVGQLSGRKESHSALGRTEQPGKTFATESAKRRRWAATLHFYVAKAPCSGPARRAHDKVGLGCHFVAIAMVARGRLRALRGL